MQKKVLAHLILRLAGVLLITATAVTVVPVTGVRAQTFNVTRFDDPAPDGCDSSDCSLREAIIAANGVGGTNTIVLGSGTYQLSLSGLSEDMAASGDLDIRSDPGNPHDLTIMGLRGSATIIDGGAIARVFQVVHASATLRFQQVTIQNGLASASGGGIHNNNGGTVTLTGSYVKNNIAGTSGGGIYNTGDLFLTSSHISGNTADSSGGGLWNNGDVSISSSVIYQNTGGTGGGIQNAVDGTVTIEYSQVISNTADASSAAYGGGIYTIDGEVTLNSTYVQNNSADSGGGIYNAGSSSQLTLLESVVSGNEATGGSGGGIWNLGGTFDLTETTISNNTAASSGGGIQTTTFGDSHVTKSTISDNEATDSGGGIYNGPGSMVTLLNSTVSGNSAIDDGGGIYNADTLTVTFSTISNNTAASQGDGVFNSPGDQIIFSNTLMANTAANDNCAGSGTYNSQDYNLDSGDTCGFTLANDLENALPMLGVLQNNGGPTSTHALLAGSDAVDAGDNSVCPFTDQRGALRPVAGFGAGGVCDIGAYELDGFYILLVPSVLFFAD